MAADLTPQNAHRHVPGPPDTTKPAKVATGTARTPTHAVTGPPSPPGNGKPVTARTSGPALHGTPKEAARPADPPQ
jgi:hypothetical protein